MAGFADEPRRAGDAPPRPVGFSLVVRKDLVAAPARPNGEDFTRELVEIVSKAAGLGYEIREYDSWTEAIRAFLAGEIDVLPAVAQLPERRGQMLFSVPHSRASLSVFTLKRNGVVRDVTALAGKRVAVIESSTGDSFLRNLPDGGGVTIVRVPTSAEQVRMLLAGKIDCLISTNLAGLEMFAEHDLRDQVVVGPPLPGTEIKFCMAVRPGSDALLARLNDGLFIAQQTGELDRIYQKWFGRFRFEDRGGRQLIQWLGFGAAGLLGLLAAVLSFHRWRVRRLQRRAAEIEALVADRTRELAAAHLRLQALFEHNPLGIVVLDADDPVVPLRITECNGRAVAMYGYPREELVGQGMDRLVVPGARGEDWIGPLLSSLEKKGMLFWGAQHRRRNGEHFPIEFAATLVRIDGRRLVLGIGRDVSAERETQQALRQAEERFRLLLEHSPSGFWDADYRKGTSWYSPRTRQLLGYTETEIPNRPMVWENLIHPDDIAGFRHMREAPRPAGRHPMTFEVRLRHKDGSWRWIRMDGLMTFDEAGLSRTLGFLTDVTDLHEVAEELAESRARYRALFEDAAIPLWEDDLSEVKRWIERLRVAGEPDLPARLLADRQELEYGASLVRVLEVNRAGLEMYGAKNAAEVAAAMKRLVIADGGASFASTMTQLLEGTRTFRIEKTTTTIDGEPRHITLLGRVLPGYEKNWGRVLISAIDITAKTAADERLRRQDAELAQGRKLRALGELAGGIAHEFNNLLTPMLLQIDLLLRERGGDPFLVENLQPVQTSISSARELTQRILTFGRKSDQQRTEVDLARLVDEDSNLIRLTMDRRIILTIESPPRLPAVWHNRTDLNQILVNLLLNARDTLMGKLQRPPTADWRPLLTVRLARATGPAGPATHHPGPWQVLSVEDNGLGMSQAVRERIFEPFFTTKETGVGTGLGLATVWHLVTGMGGSVQVQSTPGEGSCFKLWLPETPVPSADAPPAPPLPSQPGSDRPAPPGAAPRVLLLEDNPMVALVTRACLQREGYTLTHMLDGLSAWECLQPAPNGFELIITDLNMPGLSGLDFIRRARTAGYAGRFIVISGLLTPDVLADLGAAGVTEVVKKPFDLNDLRAALERSRR